MRKERGFSLIEMMMAVALVAALVAVALPSYRSITADMRRHEAIQAMSKIHQREHLYIASAREHAWEMGAGVGGMNIARELEGWRCGAKADGEPAKCENSHFEIHLVLDPIDRPDYSDPADPDARKRVRWAVVAIPKAGGSNAGGDRFGIEDNGSRPNWAADSAGWDFSAWARTGSWASK